MLQLDDLYHALTSSSDKLQLQLQTNALMSQIQVIISRRIAIAAYLSPDKLSLLKTAIQEEMMRYDEVKKSIFVNLILGVENESLETMNAYMVRIASHVSLSAHIAVQGSSDITTLYNKACEVKPSFEQFRSDLA